MASALDSSIETTVETTKIKTEYTQNKNVVEVLIHNAIYALKSERCDNIFNPLPTTWLHMGITKASEAKEKLDLILDSNIIIDTIDKTYTDSQIIKTLSQDTFDLIFYVISSNRDLNMINYKLINIVKEKEDDHTVKSIKLTNNFLKQFKMNYNDDIEKCFQMKKTEPGFENTIYLYHGTPYENMYSIFRNGLKNASTNKKLALHGAAYGNGIYLSNNVNISLGYCYGDYKIILIYEVCNKKEWNRSVGIYVVPDENALILRYMLVFDAKISLDISLKLEALNNKLSSGGLQYYEQVLEERKHVTISEKCEKRLMLEYKRVKKNNPEELGFIVNLSEDSKLKIWNVSFNKINEKLELQMKKLNISHIQLEIIFPDQFPFEPPFVRIVSPRFKLLTGHITSGGSLCMQLLRKQDWIPTTTVESLIMQIKIALIDGNAQIDESMPTNSYSLDEAKISFERAMEAHKAEWSVNSGNRK